MNVPIVQPRLIVKDAPRAINFYREVFGAELTVRLDDPQLGNTVVHAELRLGNAVVTLTEESPEWNSKSPHTLGGTPVVLTLRVDDPDAVADLALSKGAEIVFPIKDQFYGHREGRIRDPFGHEWILSKLIEEMSVEEMQLRMAEWWKTQK